MKQSRFTLRLCAAVWLLTALPLFMSSCTEKEDGDDGSKKVAVTGVRVDPESVVCAPGDVVSVKVTVLPENATDRSCTWSTGDVMVAVVEEGNIRAIAAGTTLLTVTTTDGGYTATCEVTVTESSTGGDEETVLMTRAGGYYFGDQWGTGYDNDYVYFLSGNVVQDNVSLSGDGMALWLDLNLPPTGATTVPEGTYIPLLEDDQDQSFTWSTGVDMGDWGIIGTFVYICESGGTPTYLMAEEGTVDISRSGSEYAVTADLTAGGRRFSFTYTGPIPLEDGRNLGGGDDYTTVELDGVFTHGEMDYYGQAYGDTGTDYANWTIYLAEDTFDFNTFDGTGHMLQLEVNTASSATREITPGTYEIFDVIEEASFVPNTAVPGFTQNGYCLGTWYILDMTPYYGATVGTAVIGREGDNYTIDFEFRDDTYKGIFRGSYTGPLAFYDGTAYGSGAASLQQAGTGARLLKSTGPRTLPASKRPLMRR